MDVRGRYRGHVHGCFRWHVRGCVRGRCLGCIREHSRGHRGLPWYAMGAVADIAVEIAVEIAMASAIGLLGVPLLAVAFHGSWCNLSGSPSRARDNLWSVIGRPWKAMDMTVGCRADPCILPRAPP